MSIIINHLLHDLISSNFLLHYFFLHSASILTQTQILRLFIVILSKFKGFGLYLTGLLDLV